MLLVGLLFVVIVVVKLAQQKKYQEMKVQDMNQHLLQVGHDQL